MKLWTLQDNTSHALVVAPNIYYAWRIYYAEDSPTVGPSCSGSRVRSDMLVSVACASQSEVESLGADCSGSPPWRATRSAQDWASLGPCLLSFCEGHAMTFWLRESAENPVTSAIHLAARILEQARRLEDADEFTLAFTNAGGRLRWSMSVVNPDSGMPHLNCDADGLFSGDIQLCAVAREIAGN